MPRPRRRASRTSRRPGERPYTEEVGRRPGQAADRADDDAARAASTRPTPTARRAAEEAARLLESLGHTVEVSAPRRARRRGVHPAVPDPLDARRRGGPRLLVRRDREARSARTTWSRRTWALAEQGRTHSAAAYLGSVGYAPDRGPGGAGVVAGLRPAPDAHDGAAARAARHDPGGREAENPLGRSSARCPTRRSPRGSTRPASRRSRCRCTGREDGLPIGVQLVARHGPRGPAAARGRAARGGAPWAERHPPVFAAAA